MARLRAGGLAGAFCKPDGRYGALAEPWWNPADWVFAPLSGTAALLQVPYLAWVTVAAWLTLAIRRRGEVGQGAGA
jgi:tryptophan-rich sensory protein